MRLMILLPLLLGCVGGLPPAPGGNECKDRGGEYLRVRLMTGSRDHPLLYYRWATWCNDGTLIPWKGK